MLLDFFISRMNNSFLKLDLRFMQLLELLLLAYECRLKKTIAMISMIGVLNANATWVPQFQYGIMPCNLTINILDSSGNNLFPVPNAQNPPSTPIACQIKAKPARVEFIILGGPTFNVEIDSSYTVSLPCLGGVNHTFTVSMSPSGATCDTTYYINY